MNTITCPNCHAQVPAGAAFCDNCGTRLAATPRPPVAGGLTTCPRCGHAVQPDDTFCGNCGSPLETDAGWLLLTHGVGPMRQYCIGATLLDLEDPSHVIGQTRDPLLAPTEQERFGYVPNVVYSCGGMIHDGMLILPYAMSDVATSIALVNLDELLAELRASPNAQEST